MLSFHTGTGSRAPPQGRIPLASGTPNAGLPRDSNREHTEEAEPPPGANLSAVRRSWRGRCAGWAVPAGPQTLSHALRDWAAASLRPMGGVLSRRVSARLRRHLAGAGRSGTERSGGQRVTARARHAALPGLGGVHSRRGEALPRRSHEGGWRQRRAE